MIDFKVLIVEGTFVYFFFFRQTKLGNSREILHTIIVDLPKKHGRGGQSALRFARLRLEKRHNYIRKCAELASQFFISQDKVNKKK